MALGSDILIPQSLKVPTVEGAETEIWMLALDPSAILPEAGEALHQVAPPVLENVQFRVALPVLKIVSVWLAGVTPPEIPLKVKEVGFKAMVGFWLPGGGQSWGQLV